MGARLVAESLVVEEVGDDVRDAARRTVARHATDTGDLARLLAMLGLSEQPEPPEPEPLLPPNPPIPPEVGTDLRCAGPCERPLWHKSWPPEYRVGRWQLMARGMCGTCYKVDRRQRQRT